MIYLGQNILPKDNPVGLHLQLNGVLLSPFGCSPSLTPCPSWCHGKQGSQNHWNLPWWRWSSRSFTLKLQIGWWPLYCSASSLVLCPPLSLCSVHSRLLQHVIYQQPFFFNSQNPGSLLTSTNLFLLSLPCGTNFLTVPIMYSLFGCWLHHWLGARKCRWRSAPIVSTLVLISPT